MLCLAIAGNVMALLGHWAMIQHGENRENTFYNQLGSRILSELKNGNSLEDVQDPLIKQNPVLQFFKTKNKKPPVGVSDYQSKGVFYLERGQYRKAIHNLDKSIMMKPNDIQSRIQRGKYYLFLLQHEKSIEDLNAAIRLQPDEAELYNYRSVAYFMQGKHDLGCHDAQKACELGYCQFLEKSKDAGFCR